MPIHTVLKDTKKEYNTSINMDKNTRYKDGNSYKMDVEMEVEEDNGGGGDGCGNELVALSTIQTRGD